MFSLDLQGGIPIYEQLYNKIFELAASGVMKTNEKLPAVRQLAKELGINPNTVQKAYAELERNGIIYSQGGRGSFISAISGIRTAARDKVLSEFSEKTRDALAVGVSKNELISIIENTDIKGDETSSD